MSKTIVQQLEEANIKISQMAGDAVAAQKLLDESNSAREVLQKEKEASVISAKEISDKVTASESQINLLNKEILDLKAEKLSLEKMANEKAIEIAAMAGVPPVPAQEAAQETVSSKESFMTQLNAISDPIKKGEFYAKHCEKFFKK